MDLPFVTVCQRNLRISVAYVSLVKPKKASMKSKGSRSRKDQPILIPDTVSLDSFSMKTSFHRQDSMSVDALSLMDWWRRLRLRMSKPSFRTLLPVMGLNLEWHFFRVLSTILYFFSHSLPVFFFQFLSLSLFSKSDMVDLGFFLFLHAVQYFEIVITYPVCQLRLIVAVP